MKSLKVIIGIPNTGVWTEPFALSLVGLVTDFSKPVPGASSQELHIQSVKGSILPQLREKIILRALQEKATHVLFLDSDQTFPSDTLRRLLARKKSVVAANVATKAQPSAPTARNMGVGVAGEPVCTKPDSLGLQKVWRVGTGVMLLDVEIFRQRGMQRPWFLQRWDEDLQDYVGEDWGFCEKLEAAGIPIFIDHTLSHEVGHIGTLSYGHDLIPWWDYEPVCGSEAESV